MRTVTMTPQAQTILNHLQNHGSLTPAEAATVYKCRHLPRRVADLKALGHPIDTLIARDATGQRYARYAIAPTRKDAN